MKCPFCYNIDSRVLDSRATQEGIMIRRRRACGSCEKRFTTYERIEEIPLVVIKKDGRREMFEGNKILNGLIRAAEKRQIPLHVLEKIINEVEKELLNSLEKEVSSYMIGEKVLNKLREIDEVAYVRFASVYREFKDVDSFKEELEAMLKARKMGRQ